MNQIDLETILLYLIESIEDLQHKSEEFQKALEIEGANSKVYFKLGIFCHALEILNDECDAFLCKINEPQDE